MIFHIILYHDYVIDHLCCTALLVFIDMSMVCSIRILLYITVICMWSMNITQRPEAVVLEQSEKASLRVYKIHKPYSACV